MNQHDLDALIFGTGEFSFAPGATSATTAKQIGYTDFGNIESVSISPSVTKVEHKGSYRGIKRTDRTVVSDSKLEYKIKCDELSRDKFLYALLGTEGTNHSQTALTGVAGAELDFETTPAVPNRWYDLYSTTGGRVRNLTALTITGKVENTDYFVDYNLGRVRFAVAESTAVTPMITAPAITADAGMKAIKPSTQSIQKGYGRLTLFDDANTNKVVYDHVDFSCEVSFDSMGDMDGSNFGEITLVILVTDDAGTVYTAQ